MHTRETKPTATDTRDSQQRIEPVTRDQLITFPPGRSFMNSLDACRFSGTTYSTGWPVN